MNVRAPGDYAVLVEPSGLRAWITICAECERPLVAGHGRPGFGRCACGAGWLFISESGTLYVARRDDYIGVAPGGQKPA